MCIWSLWPLVLSLAFSLVFYLYTALQWVTVLLLHFCLFLLSCSPSWPWTSGEFPALAFQVWGLLISPMTPALAMSSWDCNGFLYNLSVVFDQKSIFCFNSPYSFWLQCTQDDFCHPCALNLNVTFEIKWASSDSVVGICILNASSSLCLATLSKEFAE